MINNNGVSKKVERNYKLSNYLLAGMLFLFVGVLVFALYPATITEVISFEVTNAPLRRGDPVNTKVEFIKYKNVEMEATRDISCDDGNLVTLTPMTSRLPVGDFTGDNAVRVIDSLRLPEKTSLGWCQLNVHIVYHLNALNEKAVTVSTEPFLVIE